MVSGLRNTSLYWIKISLKLLKKTRMSFYIKLGKCILFHGPSIENVGDLMLISRSEIIRVKDKIA